MVKHTQTIRRQFANKMFECVWPFCDICACWRLMFQKLHGRTFQLKQKKMIDLRKWNDLNIISKSKCKCNFWLWYWITNVEGSQTYFVNFFYHYSLTSGEGVFVKRIHNYDNSNCCFKQLYHYMGGIFSNRKNTCLFSYLSAFACI